MSGRDNKAEAETFELPLPYSLARQVAEEQEEKSRSTRLDAAAQQHKADLIEDEDADVFQDDAQPSKPHLSSPKALVGDRSRSECCYGLTFTPSSPASRARPVSWI